MYNKGSERQDEFDLNVYQTFFRVLDPAIARWWQVDPKPNEALSAYSSMHNNPILFNDALGDTIKVNLFGEGDNQIYHDSANNSVETESDDGVFMVFGHGAPGVVLNENRGLVTTGKEFNAMMSEKSPEFKKALADKKSITLHLLVCNAAAEEHRASNGKVYKEPNTIAKDISRNLPKGSKVIAPNGYLMVNGKRGYRTVLESNSKYLNTGNGAFLTIVDGQISK